MTTYFHWGCLCAGLQKIIAKDLFYTSDIAYAVEVIILSAMQSVVYYSHRLGQWCSTHHSHRATSD
jgi:cell division protein FtsL